MADRQHQQPATIQGKPRLSRRRKLVFRLFAVAFPVFLLLLLEALFRLVGIGEDLSLVVPRTHGDSGASAAGNYCLNSRADLPFFGQTDIAGPEPRPFFKPRPERTIRIVVLGGSTVIGFPYGPDLAFPRQLEYQLRQQNPGSSVEVLNAGVTSLNSFAVNDLVRQSLRAEPSVVVIHTGHNEFYGPGGPASTAFNLPPWLIRACYRYRRWRVVQKVADVTAARRQLTDDLLDILPQQLEVATDDPIFAAAAANYEQNLRLMVQTCRKAGVPVLLTTVACNLRDQSPLLSGWDSRMPFGRDEWEAHLQEAADLINRQEYEAAMELVQSLADRVPERADLEYRRGQCLLGLGQPEAAWQAFSRARDLDRCRFRIPGSFHDIVKKVAADNPQVPLLDTQQVIRDANQGVPPGYDLFLEHVHYNFEGHHLLGRAMARVIQTKILGREWQPEAVADVDRMKELAGYLVEDELAATSFALQVFQTQPFSMTLDKDRHIQYLADRAKNLFQTLSAERAEAFAELRMDQMSDGRLFFLCQVHQRRKNAAFVQTLKRVNSIRQPWVQLPVD